MFFLGMGVFFLFSSVRDLFFAESPAGLLITKMLRSFRWMVGKSNRDIIDLTVADLQRDAREMLANGMPGWYISACLLLAAIRSVFPIFWHLVMAVLKNLAGAAGLVRGIIGRK
jgi:hypothetical protein